MSTTTTTNLNFTKPDIGTEPNNWGNLLNTNFDELDKAIGQMLTKSVAGNADITLTSSESQYAVLELTGALTGNISVKTYNDGARPYIVFNNTSGSYTLTFKTANGSGVTITQGQKQIVYSDGTNMVSAVETDSFASSKTITLSGDVTGSVSTTFSTNPSITTAIDAGVIVDADVNASAAIDATKIANGNVSNTEYQSLDGVTGSIVTTDAGKTFDADMSWGDAHKAKFGDSDDLQIWHDGSHSYIKDDGTGGLVLQGSPNVTLQTSAGADLAEFNTGGSTELFYNASKKFETSNTGATITGTLAATAVTGDGSGLTNIGGTVSTSGSAPYYGLRAWVRFNSNSSNSIAGSGNVSSITDYAVGKYGVNFSTGMPNANYGVEVTVSSQAAYFAVDINGWLDSNAAAPTTSGCRISCFTDYSLAWRDTDNIMVAIYT